MLFVFSDVTLATTFVGLLAGTLAIILRAADALSAVVGWLVMDE